MKSKEIINLIEKFRPITMSSSLPVLSGECISWFNYTAEETAEGIRVIIYNVFKVVEGQEPEKIESDESVLVNIEECQEPEISYPEYMEALDNLQNDYSKIKMQELLKKAVSAPLFPLYDSIM